MTRTPLDSNLKQAVALGTPVEIFDPTTLISAEQFQKLASATTGDDDPRDAYPLIDQVMADDDALDPLLESYQ